MVVQRKPASISDTIIGYNIWKCSKGRSGMCSGVRISAFGHTVPTLTLVEKSTKLTLNEA